MQNRQYSLFFFFLFFLFSHVALAFDSNEEYMITCYTTPSGGVAIPSEGNYPLMHDSQANKNTDNAFWIINEEEAGKYSIKNVQTNQYIRYFAENYDTRYIELVNLQDDNTTLFTFVPVTKDGTEYYAVRSVANPDHVFNQRSSGIVGTYSCVDRAYGTNELFLIRTRESLPNETQTGDSTFPNRLNSLTFNQKDLAYCADNKSYFYSIPQSQMDSDVTLSIQFTMKTAGNTMYIEKQNVTSGSEFTFVNVEPNKQYKIEIRQNDQILATSYVIFTNMPIVQLYSNGNSMSSSYSRGEIRVHDSEFLNSYELLNTEMRYRGASAQGYQKKSFALKIKDENWQSLNKSYFGFRDDNYWILDAMAVDRSRMRNRVATDLWNDFSTAPYYKEDEPGLINGTRGRFVELFLDDRYWGIYCMTERIDRKQLKLKKFREDTQQVRGLLYKTTTWSYSVMMGYRPDVGPDLNHPLSNYNNASEYWEGYEAKYPDLEDGEIFNWKPLYDVVDFVSHSSTIDFANKITQYIDLPVWADYYLFLEMILATDNHGKNAYFHIYDALKNPMLGITPWDLDGSLGRRWNGGAIDASQDFTKFIIKYEHGEHNAFRRLKLDNVAGFNDLLKKRYDQLRFSYFAYESLLERFENYKEIFENSGASVREINRWNGANGVSIDFDNELDYLDKWLQDRTQYLNTQYGKPNSSDGEINPVEFSYYPNPVSDWLSISNITPNTIIQIYTQQGVCVYSQQVETDSVSIDCSSFPAGFYYLKTGTAKGKVIVKK